MPFSFGEKRIAPSKKRKRRPGRQKKRVEKKGRCPFTQRFRPVPISKEREGRERKKEKDQTVGCAVLQSHEQTPERKKGNFGKGDVPQTAEEGGGERKVLSKGVFAFPM